MGSENSLAVGLGLIDCWNLYFVGRNMSFDLRIGILWLSGKSLYSSLPDEVHDCTPPDHSSSSLS